jgi:flagellar basal body-associated protein FliL
MSVLIFIIVAMLLFIGAIALAAFKFGNSESSKKTSPTPSINSKKYIPVSKEDLLILSIIPVFIIFGSEGAFLAFIYMISVIVWVLKQGKKTDKPSYTAQKQIEEPAFDLEQNWEGGDKLPHKDGTSSPGQEFSKQDKMKVLAGVDFGCKHPKALHTISVIDDD